MDVCVVSIWELLQRTHIHILVHIRFCWAEVDFLCYRVGVVLTHTSKQLSKAAVLFSLHPTAVGRSSHPSLPSKHLLLSDGFVFILFVF